MALLRLAVTGLTALGLSQILPLPAAFGQTYYYGGLSISIPLVQLVRSVTLDKGSLAFTNCAAGGVSQPALTRNGSGECAAGPVRVTLSGNATGHVSVAGSDAFDAADGVTVVWTLTTGPTPPQDFYALNNFVGTLLPLPVSPKPTFSSTIQKTASNDYALSPGAGAVSPGTFADENFWITGPTATSNTTATALTTSVSWTAAP